MSSALLVRSYVIQACYPGVSYYNHVYSNFQSCSHRTSGNEHKTWWVRYLRILATPGLFSMILGMTTSMWMALWKRFITSGVVLIVVVVTERPDGTVEPAVDRLHSAQLWEEPRQV